MRDEMVHALRQVFDDAAEVGPLRALNAELREDRDKWKTLAEQIGISSSLVYDTTRHHLKLSTIIDGQLLAQATSTRMLVAELVRRIAGDYERELRAKGQWR